MTQPSDVIFSDGEARALWVAEWLEDGLLGGNPDFFFNVSYGGESLESNELDVLMKECVDVDEDGYGVEGTYLAHCSSSTVEGDCDDGDYDIKPGAEEVCDGVNDDNCDGTVDEGCDCTIGDSRDCGTDVGECEFGTQPCNSGKWGTCIGGQESVNETCDGKDNDCDGVNDDGFTNEDCEFVCALNGFGVIEDGSGFIKCCGNDYGEGNPFEFGEEQTCNDGNDNDCNGFVDCLDINCDGLDGCEYLTEQSCEDGFDNDGDGPRDCEDTDCSDAENCVVYECDGVNDIEEGFTDETCAFVCDAHGHEVIEDGSGFVKCCGNDPGEGNPFEFQEETCDDGRDNDCDLFVDCEDSDCDGSSCDEEGVCIGGSCVRTCERDSDCEFGEDCVDNICVLLGDGCSETYQTDPVIDLCLSSQEAVDLEKVELTEWMGQPSQVTFYPWELLFNFDTNCWELNTVEFHGTLGGSITWRKNDCATSCPDGSYSISDCQCGDLGGGCSSMSSITIS